MFIYALVLPKILLKNDTSFVRLELRGCVRPLSLFYSDASADGVVEIARSVLSLARSAQAERDNESCFLCVQPASIDL
ncbi:hypothetical protein EVAR_96422_1 [Eumeta japonica]|uniref:Uncharacterized protein n=1 Tax=Eumeta variegata TaxID=151549 RepID=A0A4C1WBF8_EUMVA|nr:hypothetical protein EVAR_96422_1 [Eumeta japonica]